MMRLLRTIIALPLFVVVAFFPPTTGRAGPDDENPQLHPQVQVETSDGAFTVELDAARVPIGVTHFMDHVERGFYRGLLFHRVLKNGLIQGGAYLPTMERRADGTRAPEGLELHSGLSNLRGVISLIQVTGREDVPPAEFFINVSTNTGLDDPLGVVAYVPIGRVIAGQDVVDRISGVPVDKHPRYAAGLSAVVPVKPVTIVEMKVLRSLNRTEVQRVLVDRARRNAEAAVAQVAAEEQHFTDAQQRLESAAKEAGREVITPPSGLKYVDVRVGKGAQPLPEDRVVMHFRGTLLNGAELNNTFLEEKPATKRVAELIPGLREGLSNMGEGGKRLFLVPPGSAFGNTGIPGRVPPNAWLYYEVELLEVLPPAP